MVLPAVVMLAFVQPQPQPAAAPAPTKALVPFPHPLITEVLYNVPPGAEGDADGDGLRSATGDEFVELVNPHDRPISLKGYVLTDGKNTRRPTTPSETPAKREPAGNAPPKRDAPPKPERVADDDSRVRFVFPDVTLQPGQVVVVFNGYTGDETPKKSTGDEQPRKAAVPADGPPEPIRLSMQITSPYAAFSNTGDCVLLTDPDGKPVQCITWGSQPKPPEEFAPLIEHAPETKARGSITRLGPAKGLVPHREQPGDLKGLPYSPGVFAQPKPAK
ncbi:MAG: hypothetical protein HBSAPP03_14470 [Phycisphaerae bacterium]|nr:MAG: hypothetical protein HBSAPP03_14470 [Phycisphaerae bacterium]